MFQEPFMAQRTIVEQKVRGRSPYFQEIQTENLQWTLSFAFQDSWTDDQLRNLANWLNVDYYKPLVFYDNLTPTGNERIFYAMPVDASQIFHNGNSQGYVQITFKCHDACSFSPVYITPTSKISSYFLSPSFPIQMPTNIEFINDGDLAIKPIFYVKTYGTDFTIKNLTNSGQGFTFTGLSLGETVTIDCDSETIESDISEDTYRYNNMIGDFITMVQGVNTLQCVGDVEIEIKYEFKYLLC